MTCFRAAWLLDGCSDHIQTNVELHVHRGRIIKRLAGVTTSGKGSNGCESEGRAFSGTIIPWLTDCHLHLGLPATANEKNQNLWDLLMAQVERLGGFGIQIVRDAGEPDAALEDWYRHRFGSSENRLPVIRRSGRAWFQAGRYGRLIGRPRPVARDLASEILRSTDTAQWVKIINSGLNSLDDFGRPTAPQFSLMELQGAVRAAHSRNRRVMVHANGIEPVRMAMAAGCDSIEHGYFMGRDNLTRLADQQIAWIPTLAPMAALQAAQELPDARRDVAARTLEHQMEQVHQALRLGVRMLPGTDAGSPGVLHGPALLWELNLWVKAGCSLVRSIQAAGPRAAGFLGAPSATGVIPGAPANWLLFEVPPERLLEAATSPVMRVREGRPV